MAKCIVVNEDEVTIKRRKIVIPSEKLEKAIDKSLLKQTQILPTRVKFAFQRGRNHKVILEDPPQVKTVKYTTGAYSGVKNYQLAFPYVIYLIDHEYLRVFFRSKPLTSFNDKLYPAILSNVYTDGRVCLNGIVPDLKAGIIAQRAEEVVRLFWDMNFNSSIPDGAASYGRKIAPVFRYFEDWEQVTKKNDKFILEIEWENLEEAIPLSHHLRDWVLGAKTLEFSNFVDALMSMKYREE